MRNSLHLVAGTFSALLLASCASAPSWRVGEAVSKPPVGLIPEDYPSQNLFRVRYRDPSGGLSLRLVLRLAGPDRFQLEAIDQIGRKAWAVDVAASGIHVVDSRRLLECRSPADEALLIFGLDPVPLRRLPEILLGRLPSDLVPTEKGNTVLRDSLGRRWTARWEDGGLAAWTLWVDDRPELWWHRSGGEAVLSQRGGMQVRWRQAAGEPLEMALVPLAKTPGVRVVDCSTLRLQAFDTTEEGL